MGISARLELDFRDVDRGMRDVVRAGKNLKPAWSRLSSDLRDDLADHQRRQEGPDGAWEKLSPNTRGRGGQKKQGIFSSKFAKAVDIVITRGKLEAVHQVSWAIAHQIGAVVGRGAKLPERVIFWLSNDFQDKAVNELGKHIVKAWRR